MSDAHSEEKAAPEDSVGFEVMACQPSGQPVCDRKIKISERGNLTYAWWYLSNTADKTASVTIQRCWTYNAEWRSETQRYVLYPGEDRMVFGFPRNQNPKIVLTHCQLD